MGDDNHIQQRINKNIADIPLFYGVDVCDGFDSVQFRVSIEQGNVSDVLIDSLLDTIFVTHDDV